MKLTRDYLKWKNELVDDIVYKKEDWSIEEWASKSGLHPTTIYNLMWRVTRNPQLRTVFLMAKAAGAMKLVQDALKKAA